MAPPRRNRSTCSEIIVQFLGSNKSEQVTVGPVCEMPLSYDVVRFGQDLGAVQCRNKGSVLLDCWGRSREARAGRSVVRDASSASGV
jgi:hypothetical protein